jgi:glycosyltransferase involved in cell wall biosynthesis
MKVLFVFSGNNPKGISPIIRTQGESLEKAGVDLHYFAVEGTGLKGYLKNIQPLRRIIREQQADIIHAHNDLCGILSVLSTSRPIITSLMGSELHGSMARLWLIRFFIRFIWKGTIVKSDSMARKVSSGRISVIPNGVDLGKFYRTDKAGARSKVGFSPSTRHVLFLADPARPEKNYSLALKAIALLKDKNIQLQTIYQSEHEMVPVYLNASDLLLLTSTWEGSPNVVKEALACGCPVVSTRVGDVEKLISGVAASYVTTDDPAEIAKKIERSLGETADMEGRRKLKEYSIERIAEKIIEKYKSTI